VTSQPRKSKVPFRNRSPSGWWIFDEVEYWVSNRQRRLTRKSRCLVWINTRIIRTRHTERPSLWARPVIHPKRTGASGDLGASLCYCRSTRTSKMEQRFCGRNDDASRSHG